MIPSSLFPLAAQSEGGFLGLAGSFVQNLLIAAAIFGVGLYVAKLLVDQARKLLQQRKLEPALAGFLANVLHAVLVVIVVIASLNQLGVQTTSVIAILGAGTLAIGLALQGSLSNFAAGFMLIMFRHFRVGDFVEAGGVLGIVEEIKIFDTRMRSPDNKSIVVPNGQIISAPITNFTARDTRRVDLVIGVSYDDDLRQAQAVLLDILRSDERVLKDPEPFVGVLEMGDSSINFAVRPWAQSEDWWALSCDLKMAIKERFDQEGITIPYPQRDVHLRPEGSVPTA